MFLVGIMLVLTAALLYLADKSKRTVVGITNKNTFIIGLSQAIAMLPGISRSGATIATSVYLELIERKLLGFLF